VTLDSTRHQYLLLLLTKFAFSLLRTLDAPALLATSRGGGVLILQGATERFDIGDSLWSTFDCLNTGG
jgi:hypothetical protein